MKAAAGCPVCGCYLGLAAGARFPLHAPPGAGSGTCVASGACWARAERMVRAGLWPAAA